MIISKCSSWFLILLSALLFNGAFLFPDVLGFCILLFPIPLFFIRYSFYGGFVWGLLVFGSHFIWLLQVLLHHSQAAFVVCVAVYCSVVAYFSASSGCWLWLTEKVLRYITRVCGHLRYFYGSIRAFLFCLLLVGYWLAVEYVIVLPFGLPGYPFINPLIPLASYKFFLQGITMIALLVGHGAEENSQLPSLIYVAPVVNRIKNSQASWRYNAEGVGQKVSAALAEQAVNADATDCAVWMSPESMFPFALNCYPHIVRLWSTVIPTNDHYLVGSVYQKDNFYYQAVYWIHQGLIIKIYVKKILTPFVEKLPEGWRNLRPIREMFLCNAIEFCDCAYDVGVDFFDITSMIRVVPRICLEFYFTRHQELRPLLDSSKATYVFFFANDSWFNGPFRKILYNLAVVRAHWINIPVVYIGHFGWHIIS